MSAIKNILLGIMHGFWDSIRGMTLVLYIDEEIHKQNAAEEAEKQKRMMERRGYMRRSPSPTPSSASAMAREEEEKQRNTSQSRRSNANADERSLESILRKSKPPEEEKPRADKKVAKKVLKCCLLNGGFTWLSIIFFNQLLLPILKFVLTLCYGEHSSELHMVWGWLQSILSILFGMMWVLPIFLLSKIVSSLWFADIANAAYRVRKGEPQMIPNLSKLVADFLFSLVVQALFLVQSMLVNLLPVPYVGVLLCDLHLCLLYSLYSFEYKWFNMGWELHNRLNYIENNWPYFLGFGVPLTILTQMSGSLIVSSCIFSIFFPLFILSGNEAKPVVRTTEIPLRLFSPVIFFSNLFFNRSGGRTQKLTAAKLAQQQQKQLRHQYQQDLLLKQQQKSAHRRRQSPSPSPSPSPSYRYRQPPDTAQPQFTRPMYRSSPSPSPLRTSTQDRAGRYGGMIPLIPTPVPGAPTGLASSQSPPIVRPR